MGKPNRKGRASGGFVMVLNTMQKSPAWLTTSGTALKLLVHLMMLSKGNNGFGDDKRDRGRLFMSERQAAKAINVSKNTAARALQELIEHGFLRVMEKGHYDVKGIATTWRLTFQPYPHTGMAPTNEWLRYPEEKEQAQKLTALGSETDQPAPSEGDIGAKCEPISPNGTKLIGSITTPHIHLPRRGPFQIDAAHGVEAELDSNFSAALADTLAGAS